MSLLPVTDAGHGLFDISISDDCLKTGFSLSD